MPTPDEHPAQAGAALFPLGQILATPGALAALTQANVSPYVLLARHRRSDWGDLDEHDRRENERALAEGDRLLSAYTLCDGKRVWVITEAGRSATTLLLPTEY